MRFVDEYRDAATVRRIAQAVRENVTRPWTIMEICGGQTHSIVRFGLDEILPPEITLVHGPGCPVCVTPIELIDKAIELASHHGVTLCSFGDMLRVPGTRGDLFAARAEGGDVRVVYSPLDALTIARKNPLREVVFFAVGFETTAPANAMAVHLAAMQELENFSMLVSHVLVPPAMAAILSSPENRVQGFLAAGHVCAVMGEREYHPLAERHRVPIVVTGFEPVDIMQGVLMCVRQLEEGRAEVENAYTRSVTRRGNAPAQDLIRVVFMVTSRRWRGIGEIPWSGLALRSRYGRFDAERRFGLVATSEEKPTECIGGLIMQGARKPFDCPAFGSRCTPEHPIGAPMVSSEGACAAYHRHRQFADRRLAS